MNTLIIIAAKYLFVVPILIAGIYFLKEKSYRNKKTIMFVAISLVATFAVGILANHLFDNPRPFVVGNFTPLIPHAADNGFPSDHTLLLAAISSILYPFSRKLGFISWALTLIVGFARIAAGVHHGVDIAGSIIIAIAVTAIVYMVLRRKASGEEA
ncbi:MAG: phosphatase family protein, partial [Candidatus Taylorbacteria bacterium]|nr:phosphatase family protein [Candidatus Taylorbacteria bacterium]